MNLDHIKEKFQKIPREDLFYIGILVGYILIILGLFVWTVSFLSRSIDSTFDTPGEGEQSPINIEAYTRVAKKLNLPVAAESKPPAIITTPEKTIEVHVITPEEKAPETTPPTSSESPSETPVVSTLNPSDIVIGVYDGSTTKGKAEGLATALINAGFRARIIGDQPINPQTRIKIKDSRKEYFTIVSDVVKTTYDHKPSEVLAETSSVDVVIVIGDK